MPWRNREKAAISTGPAVTSTMKTVRRDQIICPIDSSMTRSDADRKEGRGLVARSLI